MSLHHPAMALLLGTLLLLWPFMRIYRRVGLSPLWALLLLASFGVPFLGLLLALLPLTFKHWPNFPAPAKPPAPVKRPI